MERLSMKTRNRCMSFSGMRLKSMFLLINEHGTHPTLGSFSSLFSEEIILDFNAADDPFYSQQKE